MCICLNCNYLQNCRTYYLIEEAHKESHLNENAEFFPQSPVISVNFTLTNKINFGLEWDVNECISYQEKPANWIVHKLNYQ